MYELNNITNTVLTLPGHLFISLKSVLTAGVSYPFKQELKDSIDFLRTLENIQVLDGGMHQEVLLEGAHGSERNLLACSASGEGEGQVLFFNISGSEFIEQYVGAAGVREFLGRAWHQTLLYVGQNVVDEADFYESIGTSVNDAAVVETPVDYDKSEKKDFDPESIEYWLG